MAASKAGSRREVLPFPSSPRDKQNAIKKHKEAKKRGLPIPHFKKKDGSIHYLDNKGNGRLMFNDLATKLANEAGRRANKLNAKPKLEHYVEAYGQKLGTQLFQAEQTKLKNIYKNTPSKTHDVDHVNSLGDGGVHHSSNLRLQNSSKNRSQGQRQLPAPARAGLMQASTPQEQVRMAGPAMTPKQRQRFMQSFEVGGGVVKKVAPKLAKTAAKFVPVVGSALVFSELGQRAQAAEQNPTALNQLQAGISSLEAAAEGASLAAYGSGIGAGLGVAADVVSLGLGLTNGAIDTVRDLVGSRRRDP